MQEKRRLRRRHLRNRLRVFDRSTEQLVGFLVHTSPDGMVLRSEGRIETNRVFELRMALPEGVFSAKRVDFDAKSLWCKPDIDLDLFDTGFQLLDVSQQPIKH